MTPRSLLEPARLAGRPVLRTQSDERLVDLVRAGYEPAFEAIVHRYRGQLVRYCGRLLPDGRAEDAVQQTFVSAYDAMRRSSARLELRPWLYRIAHNASLNALRDRALRHEPLSEHHDGVERPEQALERTQGLREVVGAVKALPERQRAAILLRELEGRSYEEIAGELGVSGGAVRQLLNRARTTLRSAATAVTPLGMVLRMPWDAPSEPLTARAAELCGTAGAGALVGKVCATALVTGAVVGAVATVPHGTSKEDATANPAAAPTERRTAAPRYSRDRRSATRETDPGRARTGGGRSKEGERHRGHGAEGAGTEDGHGGPGVGESGEGDFGSRSGSGPGRSGPGSDPRSARGPGDSGSASSSGSGSSGPSLSSGPSSSGDGSSGSGSDGSSGPGSSDSGRSGEGDVPTASGA